LSLAEQDSLSVAELQDADELCLCAGAEAADGRLLRRVLFEEVEERRPDDRYRQLTARMLLEAIRDAPSEDVSRAFRERWGFGAPVADADEDTTYVACGWRAAILRNYSVGAWRELWRWLAAHLTEQPMTVEQLGDKLSNALGDLTVVDLIDSLPPRIRGEKLLPAETFIADEDWTPLQSLRQLALGAARLDDLGEPTRAMFIGTDPSDLGPVWVSERLTEWQDDRIGRLAHELTEMLVRRAKRVSLSKMRLVDGRPWVPTRLRDRDGLLSVHGEEGAGDVSLRSWSLAEILAGLGAVDQGDDNIFRITARGEDLYERLT